MALIVAGILGFSVAYSALVDARSGGTLGPLGFSAGLLLSLAMALPVMAAGIYVLVHGDPDTRAFRQRTAAAELVRRAELEQWADLWPLFDALDVDRQELADLLAEAVREEGVAAYVDWRKGVLAIAPGGIEGQCPKCGADMPEAPAESDGSRVCGRCRVEVLLGSGHGPSKDVRRSR
jgi:hypothetical protein